MKSYLKHVLSALLIALLMSGCVIRIERPAVQDSSLQRNETGPLFAPDTSGLSQYEKHKLFASRYIEEGDYRSALDELGQAAGIREDDPELYERTGIAYDGDRQPDNAYMSFLKAADLYLENGDIDRAEKMLGWLRTYGMFTGDIHASGLEERISKSRRP